MAILFANTFIPPNLSNPNGAAETVMAMAGPIVSGQAGRQPIHITGTLNVTPASSTSGIKIGVRQGSLTGPLVGATSLPTHSIGNNNPVTIPFSFTDNSGWASGANQSYAITITEVGGAGVGTINLLDVKVDQ